MDVYSDWDNWKKTLGGAVNIGKKVGMEEETIVNMGTRVANFLNRVDPENPQQRLLKELWEVGDEEEQQNLASMIVKMVQKE